MYKHIVMFFFNHYLAVFILFAAIISLNSYGSDSEIKDKANLDGVLNGSARETKSLDGTWQIIFDRENVGEKQAWFKNEVFKELKQKVPIRVPSCWEETEQDYEGVAWYERHFTVPENWQGKNVRINFNAVNYVAEVWLNDEVVGYHEGGYTPFEFDISDLLKFKKENVLIMRVIGPIITKEISIDGIARQEMPHWRGAITGGIWQTVELIATEPTYIKDVFIEPKINKNVAIVHVEIYNAGLWEKDVSANFKVFNFKGPASIVAEAKEEIKLIPGINKLNINLKIDNPVLWSPENPYLYVSEIQLEGKGKVLDLVKTRFGMREFTIRNGDFYLNGERLYIKAGFFEGVYPTTLAYPENDEFMRKEIMLAKQAGFNTLRLWRKPPPPSFLDLADELGICIIDCPPLGNIRQEGPRDAPQMENRIITEVKELILRDRNHPSVIYWEIFNEILRKSIVRLRHKTALVARNLDPTRLIVAESGSVRHSWRPYIYLPYSFEIMEEGFLEKHKYFRSPVNNKSYNYLLTYGELDVLTFMSEVGYGGLPDLPSNMKRYEKEGNPKTPDYRYHKVLNESLEKCITESGLNKVFNSVSEFCLATQELQAVGNKLQLEALRINPNMDGYCLHAFTGGDWVLGAGILDIWKEPKKAYFAVQEVNRPIYLAVRTIPRNVYAGQDIKLKVTAVSEVAKTECSLIVEVIPASGKPIYRKDTKLKLKTGTDNIFELNLATGDLSGEYTLKVKLERGNSTLSENSYSFSIFNKRDLCAPTKEFRILDPNGLLRSFLKSRDIKFKEFTIGEGDDRFVFVCTDDVANIQIFEKFVYLLNYAKRGGIVVFLKPPIERLKRSRDPVSCEISYTEPTQGHILYQTGLLPFRLMTRRATGNWVPVGHAVQKHPIFEGLPVNCLMGQTYENICSNETIIGLEGESVVSSISWDWIQNYLGPSNAWWGSDLVIVPYGKGKIILSTLQLLENLGKDPVADKIFYNMIRYTSKSRTHIVPPKDDFKLEVEKYMQGFKQIK